MILTAVGYLLLFLSGLAICLFCWLSYSCVKRSAAPPQPPPEDQLLEHAAEEITPPIGAGGG